MADEEVATAEETKKEELTEEEQQMAKLKEAIDVQVEDIGTLRKKLTITVPKATVGDRRSEQFGEIKRDSVVPGFRKGHAPLKLVEKRFGQDVNLQLSSQLLSSSYLAATEKEDLKIIGDPLIWARDKKADESEPLKLVSIQEAFDMISLPADGDFSYSCEVETRPEFELPELEGIKIEQPTVDIGKKQVDEYIDRVRGMRGRFEPVPDDKIKEDDIVVCKFKASVDGKVLLEEENCQLAARPQRYAGILMEDLGTVLSGCKVGDKKELEGQFPDDYVDESVRGKTGQVELEILDIKRLVLPDLDAEFLEALGFETKKELEENVKEILESQKHEEVRHLRKDQVCTYLLENCKLELPERMSQQQTSRIVARRMLEMARRGVPESELEKHADAIRTGAESDSAKDLNLHFIFEKIADEWDIDVSEDEINGQIAMIARRQNRRFDRVRDDLMRNNSLQPLYVHVRDEKIVDRILEKAEIVESSSEKDKPKTKKKTTKKAATKKTGTKKTATKKKS